MPRARRRIARNELQSKLLELERRRGMKPSHVARAAGMSLVYYQEIWSKNRIPSKDIILRIARALEEDPKALLFLAEQERAPAEAKQYFTIRQIPRFPQLRRALIAALTNGEELEAEIREEPLSLLEKWIYYILLAHQVEAAKARSGQPRRFTRMLKRFAVLLDEAAATDEEPVFAAVADKMESFLESKETQDELVDLLKRGISRLSYHKFALRFWESDPKGRPLYGPVRYVFMSDAAAGTRKLNSQEFQSGSLKALAQPEPYRSYDPERFRRAILYSPDFDALKPGLKDLVYDEALFGSLRVTPNEFSFLQDAKVRGYGGEPLKEAYLFLLDQYRKGSSSSKKKLSDDEERLLELYRELNEVGKEEILIYLEFTRSKARFRRSAKDSAATDQAG